MAETRRYRRVQDGFISAPITATDAAKGLAGLDDGEWEVEGDKPNTWGKAAKGESKPRRTSRRKPNAPASAEPAGDPAPPEGNTNES